MQGRTKRGVKDAMQTIEKLDAITIKSRKESIKQLIKIEIMRRRLKDVLQK